MPTPPIETSPYWEIPSVAVLELATPHPRMISHFHDFHKGLHEIVIEAAEVYTTREDHENLGVYQRFVIGADPDKDPTVDAETLCRMAWISAAQFTAKQKHALKIMFRFFMKGRRGGIDFRKQTRATFRHETAMEFLDKAQVEDDQLRDDEQDHDALPDTNHTEALPALREPTQISLSPDQPPGPAHLGLLVRAQEGTLQLAKGAYEGPMAENRALVREMRAEMSSMVRDIKGAFETNHRHVMDMVDRITTFAMSQATEATTRVRELESRVVELSKTSHRQYENLQSLAQQGWVAFLDAMKMRKQDMDDRDSWSRQIAEQRLNAQPPSSGPSALSTLFSTGAPMAMAVTSAVLRRRDPQSQTADLFDALARSMAGVGTDEPMEEEEAVDEDEDVVETSEVPPPFAARAHAFRASLSADKLEKMKATVSDDVWKSFEAASTASSDRAAVRSIKRLEALLVADPLTMMKLGDVLTEQEVEQIMVLIRDVRSAYPSARKAPPTRPSPA